MVGYTVTWPIICDWTTLRYRFTQFKVNPTKYLTVLAYWPSLIWLIARKTQWPCDLWNMAHFVSQHAGCQVHTRPSFWTHEVMEPQWNQLHRFVCYAARTQTLTEQVAVISGKTNMGEHNSVCSNESGHRLLCSRGQTRHKHGEIARAWTTAVWWYCSGWKLYWRLQQSFNEGSYLPTSHCLCSLGVIIIVLRMTPTFHFISTVSFIAVLIVEIPHIA